MILRRYLSITGLLLGTMFFALSMTPSLLPRTNMVQGIISGLALSSGYGIGVFVVWVWSYFELPKARDKIQNVVQLVAAGICVLFAIVFLWRASGWQNSLRALMDMGDGTGVQPFVIGITALVVFLLVLTTARLFWWFFRYLSWKLQGYVSRRFSNVIGLMAAFFLFWSVVDGVLFTSILRVADSTYQQVDALMEPEFEKPSEAIKAGSIESLLNWEDMGRKGRRFLSGGPDSVAISEFLGDSASNPIRVYVGMNAAESFEERASLALQELIRLNAFDRSIMVLITPTGTGWVDEASIDPLEYLHRGDIASVAAQYSYLPSPLALLAEEDYGTEMARALFREVYGYWTELPVNQRPKLYLHGLSLGALNSDRSFDFFDIINDPFHGAFWSGPPFRSTTWRELTERRNPDSPAWLPRFRDGSVVRFANQDGGWETGTAKWGDFRIAFLQYASDPVTFFDPQAYWREPDWITEPRGRDVSENLRWYPVITMLQLAADMAAGSAPPGYGHEYAASHYLDAWYALTEPPGWSAAEIERLRELFEQ